MGVNAEKLLQVREYKIPRALNFKSDEEFDGLIRREAANRGIKCAVTKEALATDAFSATLNLGGSCKMIQEFGTDNKKPRGFMERLLDNTFDRYYGNYVVTFHQTGIYNFVTVYQYTNGSPQPLNSDWAAIMGDVIDEVMKMA